MNARIQENMFIEHQDQLN